MAQKEPYTGQERRTESCDICVKDDFATVKKLVFIILAAIVVSGSGGAWAVYASSDKDSAQDSRITAVEINQVNILKNQADQSAKLDKLLELSTQINIQVKTHIAISEIDG